MSSLAARHPEESLLLRYVDGELPARKMRAIERHLEACWQCRTEIEELQATVADCVRYRKNVLAAHLPPPPNPWPDLARDFARIDALSKGEPWAVRMMQALRAPALRPWAITAAAALVLAAGLYYQLRETPAVQAAALLKQAADAAVGRPAASRTLRIRTKSATFTRTLHSRRRPVSDAAEASLEARFEAARYSWEDPLSATSFQNWRNGLASKSDEVRTVPNPQSPAESCYQIRTTTPDGDLVVASLLLTATGLEPVEARFEFRDREWVEINEFADASIRDSAPPAVAHVGPPPRQVVPSQPAATSSGAASISEELRVMLALHEVGADLGDPVEVSRSEGRIVVGGVGVPAQRQAQIHERLAAMPNVVVHFSEPTTPAVPEPEGEMPASGAAPKLHTRIEQQFSGRAEFERFSSYMLDRNEAMMARAYALRALAQRFPADHEAALSAQDRQALRNVVREHTEALGREEAAMQRLIQPVLVSMGASAALRPAPAAAGWQSSAEELFRSSRRVEVLLSSVLGVSRSDVASDRLPSELLSAMAELRTGIDRSLTVAAQ
jgi:hypothetical protein